MYFKKIGLLALCVGCLFAQGVKSATIGQAFLLFEQKHYLDAAALFYEVKVSDEPEALKDESEMALAQSLSKAGLSLSALHVFEGIVAKGVTHRHFVDALVGLLAAANDIGGEVLVAQLLDKTYGQNIDALAKLDAKTLQYLHFVLAKRAFRAGRPDESLEFAQTLQVNHNEYARAQYILGVLKASDTKVQRDEKFYTELRGLFDAASRGDQSIRDMSNLAKARIAYERGMKAEQGSNERTQFLNESVKLYRLISVASSQYPQSLFEKAWAHTALNQPDLALGALYALNHPGFAHWQNPEAEILKAINYLGLCDYENASRAALGVNQTLSTSSVGDRQFAIFNKLIAQVEKEVQPIKANEKFREAPIGHELVTYLFDAKRDLGRVSETWGKQKMARDQARIDRALTKAKLIQVEAATKESQLLSSGINVLKKEQTSRSIDVVPPRGSDRWILAKQELWTDELSDLRLWVDSQCM